MPGRSYSAGNKYRYGFNGQEKSDENCGCGNTYSAQFWEYDSRTGRRYNIDPVEDIGVSPYATNRNNPILYSDPEGDCPFCPFIIGFVSDVVAQGVANLINGDSFFKNINYYSAAVSGLSAQFGGLLSATKLFSSGSKLIVPIKQVAANVIVSAAENGTKQVVETGEIDPLKLATDVGGDLIGGVVTKNANAGNIAQAEKKLDNAVRSTASRSASRQAIKINPAKQALEKQKVAKIIISENTNNAAQETLNQVRNEVGNSVNSKTGSNQNIRNTTSSAAQTPKPKPIISKPKSASTIYTKDWVMKFGQYYTSAESFNGANGTTIKNPFYKKP